MHPRSSSTQALMGTYEAEPIPGGAVLKTQRISHKPTTRTYVGQAPILGLADIVNEENAVYPFFKKDEKVPIIDTHLNKYDPYNMPMPGYGPGLHSSWSGPLLPPHGGKLYYIICIYHSSSISPSYELLDFTLSTIAQNNV